MKPKLDAEKQKSDCRKKKTGTGNQNQAHRRRTIQMKSLE